MPQDLDLSWETLRQIVRDWAGADATLTEVRRLDGGCINTTVALRLADDTRAVLKISPHRVDRSYECQARQLDLLRSLGIPTPRVYACHTGTLDHPYSYLLMEFIEGMDWGAARRQAPADESARLEHELADLLLRLHGTAHPHYGAIADASFTDWPACYRSLFDPIFKATCKSAHLGPKARKSLHRVHDRLDRLLAHDDHPRLVHWDVWSTNLLARRNGDGHWHITAMLDPDCKYAHYEVELAYLELFQTVSGNFFTAYQRDRRLPREYHQMRKPVYQLYALMNHACLFGDRYTRPLSDAVNRVGALV